MWGIRFDRFKSKATGLKSRPFCRGLVIDRRKPARLFGRNAAAHVWGISYAPLEMECDAVATRYSLTPWPVHNQYFPWKSVPVSG